MPMYSDVKYIIIVAYYDSSPLLSRPCLALSLAVSRRCCRSAGHNTFHTTRFGHAQIFNLLEISEASGDASASLSDCVSRSSHDTIIAHSSVSDTSNYIDNYSNHLEHPRCHLEYLSNHLYHPSNHIEHQSNHPEHPSNHL